MNTKIIATLALLAATTLLQACSVDQLIYGRAYVEYQKALEAWEYCEQHPYLYARSCGMRPSLTQYERYYDYYETRY